MFQRRCKPQNDLRCKTPDLQSQRLEQQNLQEMKIWKKMKMRKKWKEETQGLKNK